MTNAFITKSEPTIMNTVSSVDSLTPTPEYIDVFTDGAAKGNGSRHSHAGSAAIFPNHSHLDIILTLPRGSTNNQAEYTAVKLALKQVNIEDPQYKKIVRVHSDSKLLIDSMTKWLPTWKRKGWKKADGKPVLNQDLLKEIDNQCQKRRVIYIHVPAHTGGQDWKSIWNDKADKAANKAAGVAAGNDIRKYSQ